MNEENLVQNYCHTILHGYRDFRVVVFWFGFPVYSTYICTFW